MRILDAGCGTAIVTAALAKMNVEKVISVDGSAAMIKRAKNHTLRRSKLLLKNDWQRLSPKL
jgi:2-polyprenyl-3-methyl-5-hydroxy-6-metoxy-1,4-benzoquinol methylase